MSLRQGFFVFLAAGFVTCLGLIARGDGCDGHNVTPEWRIRKGDPIQLKVKANGRSITPGTTLNLGYICAEDGKVEFEIIAFDPDYNVCEPGIVLNYIKKTSIAVEVLIEEPERHVAWVNLDTAPAAPPLKLRKWNGVWQDADSLAGETLIFRFSGLVDDVNCSAPKHIDSHDPPRNLIMEGYKARVTILKVELEPKTENDRIVCVEGKATWTILAEGGSEKGKLSWTSEPDAAIVVKKGIVELSQDDEVENGDEVTVEAKDGKASNYMLTLKHVDLETCSDTEDGTVIKVELKQTDTNQPLDPINRMCSNAQPKYKNVKYKVKIKPSDRKAKLKISGSAKVKFADGTRVKDNVADGTEVTLTAKDTTTGPWKLTAKSVDVTGCQDEAENLVFRFELGDPRYNALTMVKNGPDVIGSEGSATATTNSTNSNYEFELNSGIWGNWTREEQITGNIGVETIPEDKYNEKVRATELVFSWYGKTYMSSAMDTAWVNFRVQDYTGENLGVWIVPGIPEQVDEVDAADISQVNPAMFKCGQYLGKIDVLRSDAARACVQGTYERAYVMSQWLVVNEGADNRWKIVP